MTITTTLITITPDWTTKIRADYSQAAAPIEYLNVQEEWDSTPFQVADAGHRDFEAAKMVAEWLAQQ